MNVLSKEGTTKWMDPKKRPLKVRFAIPTAVDSYILMTAFNDAKMDIMRWQVAVSNDDKDYQIIHRIEDIDFPLTQTPLLEQPFGHVSRVSHASPVNPGVQKHFPMEHSPRPLHFPFFPGHLTAREQSSPANPGLQKHSPNMQTPLDPHPLGHLVWLKTTCKHLGPFHPGLQKHFPAMHCPCPSQPPASPGHLLMCSQLAPCQPGWQRHWPSGFPWASPNPYPQTPWPLQLVGHPAVTRACSLACSVFFPQLSPAQPGKQ